MEIIGEPGQRSARRCRCRVPQIIAARLAKIPPRYEGASLAALEAKDNHPKQAHVIRLMQINPTASFVFCGDFNSGKTHFMWALYSEVAKNLDRRVVACSMLQLINEYRDAFRPRSDDEGYPQVSVRPNDLMQSAQPYSLFFDDIDKPKMSDYVAEQIHALFDAAYIYGHQIVVTTNLMPDALVSYFERADERYGGAIVRRIIHDDNILVEMN